MPATKHRPQAAWNGDNREVAKWQRRFAAKTTNQDRRQGDKNAEATDEHLKQIDQQTNIEQRPATCQEDLRVMPPWTTLPGAQVLAATITEHPATLAEAVNYRTLPQKFKQARRAGYVLST